MTACGKWRGLATCLGVVMVHNGVAPSLAVAQEILQVVHRWVVQKRDNVLVPEFIRQVR